MSTFAIGACITRFFLLLDMSMIISVFVQATVLCVPLYACLLCHRQPRVLRSNVVDCVRCKVYVKLNHTILRLVQMIIISVISIIMSFFFS